MKNKNQEYAQHSESGLLRKLGLMTAVMIIMGNMIGSGIFKKAAPMADQVQSPGLLLACWLIAGIVTLCGALSNAEVAGLISGPGGYYDYFKKMYGRFFAFMFGWGSFSVMQSASIASIAYIFGHSANALIEFPRMGPEWEQVSILGIFFPFENLGVKIFTIGTLTFITAANYCGVIFGGVIASLSTLLKIIGILIVIVFGLFFSNGSCQNLMPLGPSAAAEYNSSLGLFGAMFAAMLGAFWAYDGWNNITSLGDEIREPKRNIPLALCFGVIGVIILYLLVNLAYLYVFPIDQLQELAHKENSIVGVEAMRSAFGNGAAQLVAILILLSTFGATNCQLMPTSRTFFAMARDGMFFKVAGHCHPRYHTPSISLVMEGTWASILVLTGTFDQLSDMVIFASFIFYGAAAFGVFVLRHKMQDTPRVYKVPGYPFVPAFFVLFCLVLVVVTIIQQPREAGIGCVLLLLGIPFYLYWNRKSAAS